MYVGVSVCMYAYETMHIYIRMLLFARGEMSYMGALYLTLAFCKLCAPDPCTLYITHSLLQNAILYKLLTPALCMLNILRIPAWFHIFILVWNS